MSSPPPPDPHARRDWPRVAVLAALTIVGVVLCVLLIFPFLPGVTWGLALAVIALPAHRQIERWVRSRNVAAGLSTATVLIVFGLPVTWTAVQLAGETQRAVEAVQGQAEEKAAAAGHQAAEKARNEAKSEEDVRAVAEAAREQMRRDGWKEYAAKVPLVGDRLTNLDLAALEAQVRGEVGKLFGSSLGVVKSGVDVVIQTLIALFLFFFALRDRNDLNEQARRFVPLAPAATDRVFRQAADAIHATVYGTFVTAAVQGITGGLVFWMVGLPAPALWAMVMTVLGVLPFVGAFLVWLPAAVFLTSQGQWWQAVVVVAWGLVMAGPVCNWLYAVLAGDRMKLHPVPVLLAFVGGLAVFGVSGMILGPCVLAVTLALIDVWRHRTAEGLPLAVVQADPPPSPPARA